MKKTNKMATIGQFNPLTGRIVHFERRVYENEEGTEFVQIGRDFYEITWLRDNGRTVHVWF